jgi:glycosyltransferase involved in cell wall biosynthesis
MKISVVISVYKDIEALSLIIEALKLQTYNNFEVIIAEDAQVDAMKKFVESIDGLECIHTSQEDLGVRRTRSQNNAILASTGEYLIFIDGDCIPAPNFVESHAILAQKDTVLSGRRLNLNQDLSKKLRTKEIDIKSFLNNFWRYNITKIFDRETRFEQGIYLNPKGFLYSFFLKNRDRHVRIIGCHLSCFKSDIVRINGFDEGFDSIMFSDDNDIDWRLKAAGLKFKSCKNAAVLFHLDHPVRQADGNLGANTARSEQNRKDNKFICEVGLNTH